MKKHRSKERFKVSGEIIELYRGYNIMLYNSGQYAILFHGKDYVAVSGLQSLQEARSHIDRARRALQEVTK